ncbi:MAG: hypothetical protein IJ971_06535 [Bacteroidales bacterium]|nr:hypothetical protein [Bacteroidales bacterium]
MKNIFKFFGIFLTVLFGMAMTGCISEDELQSADVGLHIKVFFPTKVVAGQPMTINGSGFSDATEIVFPEGVAVTDFQIVSNDMIRVNAPAGISAEGGHIVVRTADDEVESPLPLTLGNTVISGYSAEPGVVVDGGTQMTIYGTDLEFVSKIEMLDKDSNPIFVEDKVFNRKGTSTIIFTVPKNVFEGEFEGKVYTIDGKTFTMPMLTYKPASDGGHLEIVETIIWENPDPDGNGETGWGGKYRFGLEGTDGNNECITTIPADVWEKMKTGTFYMQFKGSDWIDMKITTGWWSGDWSGGNIQSGDERFVDNGDGTYTIEIVLAGDPVVDLVDQQHLLFTGGGYTPLKIFFREEVWVGGGGSLEIVKNVFWKNDGSAGEISWSGTYRFGLEGNDGLNECIATFPAETWDIIKNGTFYMSFSATAAQLRITDGWWSTTWTGADIMAGDERIIDNGDGTYYIEINLDGDPLKDVIDTQHLLLTGSGYTPLELYTQEEVWVGGGDDTPKEVVLWEGEAIAEDWGNQPNILSDAGVELQEAGAKPGQTIYFYMEPIDPSQHWYLELVEGHWNGTTYLTLCAVGADTQGKFVEYDLDANGGRAALEITQEMLDVAYVQQWWGGTFIANGDNLKITKVTLM